MFEEKKRLSRLCVCSLEQKELAHDPRYKHRLKYELRQINIQGEHEYVLDLYDVFQKDGLIFPENENNSLVDFLLGLTDQFDIDEEAVHTQGEMPDIDIDYIKAVRDYLKRDWAAKEFGQDRICEIGTYGTSGIKSAILDMTGVHGISKSDIQSITVKMEDKDDEGKSLEWEKIFEIATFQIISKDERKKLQKLMEDGPVNWEEKFHYYKEKVIESGEKISADSPYVRFAEYCEDNPEVSKAARLLIGRNRSGGVHAGGLIISDRPIDGFVPLEVRSVKKDTPKGVICSAWTEGLNAQDLQPVGLIKFDLLVINNLMQIAIAANLVKERHGLDSICAAPGSWDFSDISYLNDPKALEMANNGDLKCVFQFDSDGIRKLVKRGGVTSFDDLVAYSALYRPGPLNVSMDVHYCKRKKKEEPYNLHPLMQPILGKTYGVMCIHANTYISMADGREIPIKHVKKGDLVHSVNLESKMTQIKECHGCGPAKIEDGHIVTLSNGFSVCLTKDHEVLTWNGMKEVQDLDINHDVIACPDYLPSLDQKHHDRPLADWLGDDESVAYLLGQLVGDGCLTSSGVSLCVGSKEAGDLVQDWITSSLPSLNSFPYFHCRSWYLSLSHKDLVNSSDYGNRKTKFSKLLEDLNMKKISWHKRVPEIIMMSSEKIRLAFLAGLFDSDGHAPNEEDQTCHITSVSEDLLSDVRKLLMMQGIVCSVNDVRVHIWNQLKFREFVGHRLVVKSLDAVSLCGATVGEVPREVIREVWQKSGLTQREFAEKFKVSRGVLREGRAFANSCTYESVGGEFGDLRYYSIKSIEVIPDQRFYAMSVADNHNLVANGIVVKNCYQEQVMEILRVVGNIPDMHTEKVRKAISKKNVKGFIKYKEVFIENGMVNLGVNEKFCMDLWDQIESFAEYGFNLSHACAYTYISSRLLWFKAHYPLEFYCAIMMCEKDDDKFRKYKLDASYHGIEICPVDINKSGVNFRIADDKIYFGFKNIKSVGEAVAERIVENQPYDGFRDFLDKFGTDAGPIKALCAIGVFDELESDYDREHLRKFHEFYKDHTKKRKDRKKRFDLSMEKKTNELCDTLLTETNTTHPDFIAMCHYTDEAEVLWEKNFVGTEQEIAYKSKGQLKKKTVPFTKILCDLASKRATSLNGFRSKEKYDDENPVTLDQFNPSSIRLDEEELSVLANKMELDGNITYPEAESLYYGFQWTHVLETSPDYTGLTFDLFMDEVENKGVTCASVQVYVRSVRKRTSKSGTEFYSVDLEDANARRMVMNVWMDDYIRWREELKKGAMLRILVRPPSGGFNTLTFKSVPKRDRKKLGPKESDVRIIVMEPQPKPEPEESVVDLGAFDFNPDLDVL